jgi:hypothetical protein
MTSLTLFNSKNFSTPIIFFQMDKILIKFEGEGKRIKGLCFHPKRMWIISSNYAGEINLYDYRMGTLIDTFNEHKGIFIFLI